MKNSIKKMMEQMVERHKGHANVVQCLEKAIQMVKDGQYFLSVYFRECAAIHLSVVGEDHDSDILKDLHLIEEPVE